MKKNLLLLCLSIIIFSCKKNKYKDLILGEWIFVEIIELYPPNEANNLFTQEYNNIGFIFRDNDSCDNKIGYLKAIEEGVDDRILVYLGSNTIYTIDNDFLKIYNLSKNTWDIEKIHRITNDTLELQINDRVIIKYAKEHFKPDKQILFDQCIISSSGCYGTCPISDVLISRNKEIIFFGKRYNTTNGYFKSLLSDSEFLDIENRFKKSNILKLQDSYSADHTDDEEISMTFIKNGKIIKTISDYGHESPSSLQSAYTPLRFLYQRLKMDTMTSISSYLDYTRFLFKKENRICALTKSESFYLQILLSQSNSVAKKIESTYTVLCWEGDKEPVILTDGRYYQFNLKNSEKIVLDLGYNFLEVNELTNKFR